MRLLRRASDVLFVMAVLLVVVALVAGVKVLLFVALAVLVVSVALAVAKRRIFRSRRQSGS